MKRRSPTATQSALQKAKSFVKRSRKKRELLPRTARAQPKAPAITQLRFPDLPDEDRWIIAGMRRSRLLHTSLSRLLLEKYLETKELKNRLTRAKKEPCDLFQQFEAEERHLEERLKNLERDFSRTAKDFAESKDIILELANKFSDLMDCDFRADLEEMYNAFQSLSAGERARINRSLFELVEAWEPRRKIRLHKLLEMKEEGN
jgi:hypothetical protein